MSGDSVCEAAAPSGTPGATIVFADGHTVNVPPACAYHIGHDGRHSWECQAKVHDTLQAYNGHRCRCPKARAAHARDEAIRRLRAAEGIVRSQPATGTVRRIQALWRMGWPSTEIAARLGWKDPQQVTNLVTRRYVYARTATRIATVYDALCMTPGPSNRTRLYAIKHGFAPPLAWDDIDDAEARPQGVAQSPGIAA